MRGFDRDLIRGKHYGQRSCEPRLKAEHMAAPTKSATRRFFLPTRSRPHMAHRVISRPRSNSVAFRAKRTLSHAHRVGLQSSPGAGRPRGGLLAVGRAVGFLEHPQEMPMKVGGAVVEVAVG